MATQAFRFLLVVHDRFSKWPEVPGHQFWASDVVSALSSLFVRYGLPVEIITDNGPQFCAEEFKGFCRRAALNM